MTAVFSGFFHGAVMLFVCLISESNLKAHFSLCLTIISSYTTKAYLKLNDNKVDHFYYLIINHCLYPLSITYLVVSSGHSQDVAGDGPADVPNHVVEFVQEFGRPGVSRGIITCPDEYATILQTEGGGTLAEQFAKQIPVNTLMLLLVPWHKLSFFTCFRCQRKSCNPVIPLLFKIFYALVKWSFNCFASEMSLYMGIRRKHKSRCLTFIM